MKPFVIFFLNKQTPEIKRQEQAKVKRTKMETNTVFQGAVSGHTVSKSQSMKQLSKGQDQTYIGEFIDLNTNEKVDYAINIDGHGMDQCIEKLRKTDLVPFLQMEYPVEEIQKYLIKEKAVPPYVSSGAVISIALVYPTRIVLLNCGDSQTILFEDGKKIYMNQPHDLDREGELEKVKNHGTFYDTTHSNNIKVLGSDKIIPIVSKYVRYRTGNLLAPTRSIGHNGIVLCEAERFEYSMDSGKNYRIVIGSDGVFDMIVMDEVDDVNILLTKTAEEIVQKLTDRWLQLWNVMDTTDTTKFSGSTIQFTPNQCDDVSACVIDIIHN